MGVFGISTAVIQVARYKDRATHQLSQICLGVWATIAVIRPAEGKEKQAQNRNSRCTHVCYLYTTSAAVERQDERPNRGSGVGIW